MGARWRLLVAATIGVAALVAPVGMSSAQDFAFCAQARTAVATNVGVAGATKAFDFEGGVWCTYGSKGPYVQRIPHISRAKFKAKGGKAVPGFTGATSAPADAGYTTVSVLKGTTELVVGAKAPVAKIARAVKAILPLVR